MSDWKRATKSNPCAACGKPDWCTRTADGELVRCMRGGDTPVGMHRVRAEGDAVLYAVDRPDRSRPRRTKSAPTRSTTPSPAIDLGALLPKLQGKLTPERLAALADKTGLPVEAWRSLGPGWCDEDDLRAMSAGGEGWSEDYPTGAWCFPEVNGDGELVGLSLRAPDGRKGAPLGAKRGLIVPSDLIELPDPVLEVEGASDVAACCALGLAAVGRPSSRSGAGELAVLLQFREGLVIGENDQKPNGDWPGRDGAIAVAGKLAGEWERGVPWAMPPDDCKDIRAWRADNPDATGNDLLAALNCETVYPPGPILLCFADIEPRSVSWLWPNRVPLGRISVLVGRPGVGKSYVTIDMAARVTCGKPWPDGSTCPVGSVIFITSEDDPHDTIRPRLDAHGADVHRLHLLKGVLRKACDGRLEEVMFTLADLEELERALKRCPDCKLIVIDPVGSFLGGKTDAYRDNEVRGVLAPVARLAEKYGAAVVVVAHTRKSTADHADDLVLGSRGFTGIARSVWHVIDDPDDRERRLMVAGKNNLARQGSGLAFKIEGSPPKVTWDDAPVELNADELLARSRGADGDGDAGGAVEKAMGLLESLLAKGPVARGDIAEAAKRDVVGWRTVERAKKELGVSAYREGFGPGGRSMWELPPHTPPTAPKKKTWRSMENVAEYGDSGPPDGVPGGAITRSPPIPRQAPTLAEYDSEPGTDGKGVAETASSAPTWADDGEADAGLAPIARAAKLIRKVWRSGDRDRARAMAHGWHERVAICTIDGGLSEAEAERVAMDELVGNTCQET